MARKIGPVDLFGRPIPVRRSRSQIELERYDRETMTGRIARLNYVKRVHPAGGFGMPIESVMVFTEAKMAFVDGLFVSVLLLCSSFIEHVLGSMLEARSYRKEAKAGLAAQIACARKNGVLDEYLLEKADRLREVRNPFVHLKPFDHEHGIHRRMMRARQDPYDILETDARTALSITYAFATRPGIASRPAPGEP